MRVVIALFVVVLGAVACSQSDAPASTAADPESTEAAPTAAVPEDIALVDSVDFVIEGDTGVLATPGESVVVDHLIRNHAPSARSIGVRPGAATGVDVELSSGSARLKQDEITTVQSIVTVPEDAEVGALLTYDVLAINVDDVTEKAVTSVQVLVTDAAGTRPSVGDDAGETGTNEQVFLFAIADDTDVDGDLDPTTLRVIAGGWLADQITSNGNGTITYVPFANVEGLDVLLYEVCDAEARCDTGLITVTIGAPESD